MDILEQTEPREVQELTPNPAHTPSEKEQASVCSQHPQAERTAGHQEAGNERLLVPHYCS